MTGSKGSKLLVCVVLVAVQIGYSQSVVECNGWIVFGISAVTACMGYFAGDEF